MKKDPVTKMFIIALILIALAAVSIALYCNAGKGIPETGYIVSLKST